MKKSSIFTKENVFRLPASRFTELSEPMGLYIVEANMRIKKCWSRIEDLYSQEKQMSSTNGFPRLTPEEAVTHIRYGATVAFSETWICRTEPL